MKTDNKAINGIRNIKKDGNSNASDYNNNEDIKRHPCFSVEASKSYGRIHLPVAKSCNISCNYCHRDYDCPNESRPGVTSRLLAPEEAVERIYEVKSLYNEISVAAVAGPGDSLADPDNTLKTFELVRKEFPELIFCMSTNGLNLKENINNLKDAGIKFITVTLNATDAAIASKIYRFVNYKGICYKGSEAAELLLEKQLEGIRIAVSEGLTVKINSVLIPGINDKHIKEMSESIKKMGVYLFNVMPMIPADKSFFQKIGVPAATRQDIANVTDGITGINIMKHCRQCRSDAAGLLGKDISSKLNNNKEKDHDNRKCCSGV
ncbi:MAG: nitrogenase cofactor biosynthesis protein NifB [Candidatus Acididesulfobacter guangdongensis]|uniref:FeMo cofactor biosynthesis protein NifB n=1 Tax=Acididesulfobacter guangdongensis TaxID=2597225 RepID=A0A519BJ64_ACIG2|nr:MAG: nitrogenase cofactor biosynthesis protein NifB [Candidatus Acididesulfobacter guangdongensis]